jgi:hypothetical protein
VIPSPWIVQSNWELETFILDARRARVLYPNLFRPGIIFTFDLNTRKEREFPLSTGVGIREVHGSPIRIRNCAHSRDVHQTVKNGKAPKEFAKFLPNARRNSEQLTASSGK